MNIWENALIILLDSDEASIVRESAALFLTNLSSSFITATLKNLSTTSCMEQLTLKNVDNSYIGL